MVARAHKLKPSASSSLLPPPLLSTAPPSPAAFVRPPSRTTLHPSFRPSLRRPLWCPPNQPHPCPSPRSSLRRLPLVPRATPCCLPRLSTHSVRETARCRTHRVTLPRVPTPPLPGRLQSSPAARQPPLACLPACLPTDSSSLCATPRSRSLLSSDCRPRYGPFLLPLLPAAS